MFFPHGTPMKGLMDYSRKKTLTFQARGDGQRYMVMVISGLAVGCHSAHVSTSRPDPSGKRSGSSSRNSAPRIWKRVRAIGVGTMGPAGPFRFEIDDVRLE